MNSNQTFNHAIFKSFITYVHLLFDAFAKVFLQKGFIREIHGKDSDKYYRIQVSNNFKIIKLNWVRFPEHYRKEFPEHNRETGFKQNQN